MITFYTGNGVVLTGGKLSHLMLRNKIGFDSA